jgi:hypothetical protein
VDRHPFAVIRGGNVVLRLARGHRRGAAGLDPAQALLDQPMVDLLRPLGEPLDQRPIIQADNLRRARALIDRTPVDAQPLGERRPLGRQVQVIGRHQLRVQPIGVQRCPAAIRSLGGVLHQHVGVELRIAGAAHAMLERHRQHAGVDVVAVGAVVVAAHPDPMGLQVANAHLEGFCPRVGDALAYLLAARRRPAARRSWGC